MIWNTGKPRHEHVDRRLLLRGLGLSAASLAASRAFAQTEDPLQQLIEQNQRGDLGQGFDSASRTIHMSKPSLPTLSPANVPTTHAAFAHYEQIVASDRWPQVMQANRMLKGARL